MDGTTLIGGTIFLPTSNYETIYFPNGDHTGVRFDRKRWILEIQKRGIKYYFDLANLKQVKKNE